MRIWVPFLDPEDIKRLSLVAIWNFSKEQGCTELISDYGAQRARYIRPGCIGTVRARTQMLINQSVNQSIHPSINCTVPAFSPLVINLSLSKILEV
jgi:hypothetical protein